jgi:hypothetical protein
MPKKKLRSIEERARAETAIGSIGIPDRKLSETILDFGEPLISQLGALPPLDVMRNALRIVIAVWNAHVMAMPLWGCPQHLAHMRGLARSRAAPPLTRESFEALSSRRLERFGDDPRAVGAWEILPDGRNGRCARSPRSRDVQAIRRRHRQARSWSCPSPCAARGRGLRA